MDDKTRLLSGSDFSGRSKTTRKRSDSEHKDSEDSRSQYGTLDKSADEKIDSDHTDRSWAAVTSRKLPTPNLTSEALPSFSQPELLTCTSSTPSLSNLSKTLILQNQHDVTNDSFSSKYIQSEPSHANTANELLDNPDNKESAKNDDTNKTLADQSPEPVQNYHHERTTTNFPPIGSSDDSQRNNSEHKEKINLSLNGLKNISGILKVFSPKKAGTTSQYLLNIENKSTKSSAAVRSPKPKAKLKNGKDSSDSENRQLVPSSKMEFASYVSNGKETRAGKAYEKSNLEEKTPFFVYYLACFATIGGLLFGYDTGIVSGSMLLIKDYFKLTTAWQEIIVSGTVGSAAVFSLLAGFTCDFFGRKITIMAASVVFTCGAVIMGVAESVGVLLAGRIVVGIGIGFASMTVPVYVAEAAPSSIRGRLVTLNQLFITIGILLSSIVAGAFSSMKTTGWRYMLGLAGVPGVVQFIGFLYLPESPRWLVMKGKEEQASKVLQQIRGKDNVQEEVKEIKETIEEDKKQEGFVLGRVIRTQHVRRALFVGCGLQVFQQLCGINTVIYYSATILKMAGFPSEAAIWLVLVPNGINFLSTIVGVALVEKLGRKKLLVVSFLGVVIALVVLAVGFQLSANFSPSINHNVTEYSYNGTILKDGCFEKNYANCEKCIEDDECGFCFSEDEDQGSCLKVNRKNKDTLSIYGRCQNETLKSILRLNFSHGYCPTDYTWMAVLGLALFVLAFAPGVGPMPWTINSEIYPMWARSTCNSLATGANWICNLLVSLFFLTLTEAITKYGAFWLFGGICFLGMLFTIVFLPETKNKTLEEVEELFKGNRKGGTDSSAYERDIPPPNYNTKF